MFCFETVPLHRAVFGEKWRHLIGEIVLTVPGSRAVEHIVALFRGKHPPHTGRRWQNVRHLGIVFSRPDARETTGRPEPSDVLDRRQAGAVRRTLVLQQKLHHARKYLPVVFIPTQIFRSERFGNKVRVLKETN